MQSASEPVAKTANTNAMSRIGTEPDAVHVAFHRLRAAYRKDPMPSYQQRKAWLAKLLQVVRKNRKLIAETISQDFGNRSFHESQIGEIFTLVTGIADMQRNLKRWMRPERRHVMLPMLPGRARVHYQPLGVVGVISPWNYPFQLAVGPLAAALAAGNRVMLKPSEHTPRTSQLLARLLGEALGPDVVAVVTGGTDIGTMFSRLPFDHLLFTGSTDVGKHVMRAAAENLTPVTLELGGKSPALLHESFSIERAAQRIAAGKWFNAGQTCIAPDYVLVPNGKIELFVSALKRCVSEAYPRLRENGDYTAMINTKHRDRVLGLITDAQSRGARAVEINPAGERLDPQDRKIAPTLLLSVNDDMRVMQEEIFGPVLPIVGYTTLDQAIEYIADRPRPLALYYFDGDRKRVKRVLQQTISGGAAINDTLIHFAVDDLPFGGVGPSGMGAYHGIEGFRTFSHKKGVFYQATLNAASTLGPPYPRRLDKLFDLLLGR
jgi:coniferyl-aldehyde dehydrogenase